jgi:PAS domain S-box-containing protein
MSVFEDTLFEALTQDLGDGLILVDSCTHALRWNPAALAMHGHAGTAPGPDSLESLAAAYDLCTADGTPLAVDRRPLAQVLRGERIKDVEILLRRKDDGWERMLSYTGRLVGNSAGQAPTAVITVRDVTERKQIERTFREQETFLELAYEAAGLGVVRNDLATGDVIFDTRAQAHYGFDVPRVPRADLQARIHPDDVDRLQREIEAVTAAAPAGRIATEYRVIHPDGSVHWLLVHVRLVFIGEGAGRRAVVGYGTSQDITPQKLVDEQLRLRSEELARIVDMLPAAIWIADDPKCVHIRGNRYANDLLNVAPDTNVSQTEGSDSPVRLRQFSEGRELGPEDLPMQKAAATGEPQVDFELRIERGDTAVVLLGGAVPLFDPVGNPRGAVAAFHDVTARKRAEEDLYRTLEELKRSNAELEQFAYVASHDLQEPLRALTGMVQLLQQRYKGKLDARADEYIDLAVEAASRMQGLIGALLAFSRVDRYGGPIEAVDMNAVLRSALANLQVAIREAQASVTYEPLPQVTADGPQITQVFQNLIANAIKFRAAAPPQIYVGVESLQDAWQFYVRDNGIGIDPAHADRIFLIFQRLHARREYPGTGIGLALCKKIVERHGGRIWVESEPGAGATFYFIVPKRGKELG